MGPPCAIEGPGYLMQPPRAGRSLVGDRPPLLAHPGPTRSWRLARWSHVRRKTRNVRGLTCPRDCPDRAACWPRMRDGRVKAVFGDPPAPVTRGVICRKVMEYPAHYGPDRLLYPMRRVGPEGCRRFEGKTGKRPSGRCAQLREIGPAGADSILRFAYGGTMGVVQRYGAGAHFFNRLGAADTPDPSAAPPAGRATATPWGGDGGRPRDHTRLPPGDRLGGKTRRHEHSRDDAGRAGAQKAPSS